MSAVEGYISCPSWFGFGRHDVVGKSGGCECADSVANVDNCSYLRRTWQEVTLLKMSCRGLRQ